MSLSLPLFLLSVFPVYSAPLGRYGNVIIGVLITAAIIEERVVFKKSTFLFVSSIVVTHMLVGAGANIFAGHDNIVHYFKYGMYFLCFYVFTVLDNQKKIAFLRNFVICCALLSAAAIVAKILQESGVDMVPYIRLTRWFETRSLETHPLIADILERGLAERISYGNPSGFAYTLFFALVSVVMLVNMNRMEKRTGILLCPLLLAAILVALSRTFLIASLAFVVLFFLARSRTALLLIGLCVLPFAYFILSRVDIVTSGLDITLAGLPEPVVQAFRLEHLESFSEQSRFLMYQLVFSRIGEYLIAGSGPYMLEKQLEAILGFNTSPESFYLSIISNYGVALGLIMACLYFLIVKFSLRERGQPGMGTEACILVGLLAFIGVFLPFDRYLYTFIMVPVLLTALPGHVNETSPEKKGQPVTPEVEEGPAKDICEATV